MCFVKTPKLPAQPAAVPRLADAGVRAARDSAISERRRSAGRAGTLLTGGGGLQSNASTTFNTLLGQN